VLDNLPWLVGSLGTMAEDFFVCAPDQASDGMLNLEQIFFQFHLYRSESAVVDAEN
jgi:hypothetical protein